MAASFAAIFFVALSLKTSDLFYLQIINLAFARLEVPFAFTI
jgi:hypothetical protein